MVRRTNILRALLVLAAAWPLAPRYTSAQGPTIDSTLPTTPGGQSSRLGPTPGSGGGALGNAPGAGTPILGGRPGATTPRVNPDTAQGNNAGVDTSPGRIAPTPSLPAAAELPVYGSLAVPIGAEEEGPETGLSLDAAIELLKKNNLDLLSKYYEIPQAQADILTASLRANPVFYADAQLIPYGQYTRAKPGGQTQYDVNVSIPLDLTRKRKYRTIAAVRAKSVLEAQFQDAVRTSIDNLYTLFVNVLAARETVRYTQESLKGLDELLNKIEELLKTDFKTKADYNRVLVQRNSAQISLADAKQKFLSAKRELSTLLNLPPNQAESLEIRGKIFDLTPAPLQGDDLVRAALETRPDIIAYRLGVQSAMANVGLQKANRLQDVYVLAQPYTLQDNTPFGLKSPTSWAIGVTIPLPLFNRNQGNIRRAQLNVSQSQIDARNVEHQAIRDVKQSEREYNFTRDAERRIRKEVLPAAEQVFTSTRALFDAGEASAIEVLNARRERNDTIRLYLDTLVRYRRAMLNLNTAVGRRILP